MNLLLSLRSAKQSWLSVQGFMHGIGVALNGVSRFGTSGFLQQDPESQHARIG